MVPRAQGAPIPAAASSLDAQLIWPREDMNLRAFITAVATMLVLAGAAFYALRHMQQPVATPSVRLDAPG